MSKELDIYLERRKTRLYVGRLSRKRRKFIFEYDRAYFDSENPIPIGPDLPLGKVRHTSEKLFPSFADRIPSKQNPAYEEYCQSVGISPLETDPFVLLSILGKKSPITPFVCELAQELPKNFLAEDLKVFRKSLGLSIREFALLFDVSQASIYRIENNKTTGRDTLKKLALYFQNPKMALGKARNSPVLNERKKTQAKNFLQSQIKTLHSTVGPFTVTPEDVQKCNSKQAVELLKQLILLECTHFNIPQGNLHISYNIPAKDGGQDALIRWSSSPDCTNFFPSKYNCFQVKAKKVSPSECSKEIFKNNKLTGGKMQTKNPLKPAIQKVIQNKGAYILFSTHPVAGIYLQVREEAIQEGIKEAGYDPTSIEVKFYDSNLIANWLNKFPTLAVWFLKEVCGKSLNPWISWQEWSKDRDYKSEFMYHAQLEQKKSALYDHLSQPQQTAHLTGPSGVGKTRLALEVFRPPTDNTKSADHDRTFKQTTHKNDISALALYSPAHLITETNIRELKNSRAILIIDDCPLDKVERFHKIALQEDSNLSLLTIGQKNPGGLFTHTSSALLYPHASSSINNSHFSDFSPQPSPQPQGLQKQSHFNQIHQQQNKRLLVELGPNTKIVSKILLNSSDLKNKYIEEKYLRLTQGFPLMAKLLRELGPHVLATDDISTIKKKMLWGLENPDPKAEKVIKALSLFDTICMEDEIGQEFIVFDTSIIRTSEELKYVAKVIAKMDYDEFYKKIFFFKNKKIIQQYGRFIQVRPKPLALWLAMELIHETPVESTIKWLSDMDDISKVLNQKKVDSDKQKYQQLSKNEKKQLKKQQEAEQKRYNNMSAQEKQELEQWKSHRAPQQALRKSFCKQIHYLTEFSREPFSGITKKEHQTLKDTHPEIQKIVQQLCQPDGFFGQENILSTGWGAECLSYLTDLAPEEILSSLKKVIEEKTLQELLNMKAFFGMPSTRRQWVWILQKLASKNKFYEDSSYLLLKLAEAENEDYSNNATGIWTSHFQLFLSGTKAHPKTKFQIIEGIKKEGTIRQKEIAVQALEKALPQNGYTGNYDSSIIDPQKEWRPATYGEMWDYHKKALHYLVAFATEGPPEEENLTKSSHSYQDIQKKAQDIIAQYLSSLLKIKALHKDVEKAIKLILNQTGSGPVLPFEKGATFTSSGSAFWPEAIKTLNRFLKYRSNREPKETINKTKELLKFLQPKAENIHQRLFLYVQESDDYQIPKLKKQNKGYSQAFTELIEDFTTYMKTAHEISPTGPQVKADKNLHFAPPTMRSSPMGKHTLDPKLLSQNDIKSIFKSLFHGKQNQTIIFAKEVAQLLCKGKMSVRHTRREKSQSLDTQINKNHKPSAEHKAIKWANKLLTYAKKWSKDPDFNPSFLCGFISGLQSQRPEETQKILDKIAHNAEYKSLFLTVYHSLSLDDKDITRLISFLNQSANASHSHDLSGELSHLSIAQKCQKVSPAKMKELILFLTSKNGEWVRSALHIYFYYANRDIEKKKALLPALFQLLTKKDLLTNKGLVKRDYTMDNHYYKQAVKDLFSLTEEQTKTKQSQQFAQFFVSQILYYKGSLFDLPLSEECMKECLKIILEKYPDMVLSEIAKTNKKELDMPDRSTLFKYSISRLNDKTLKKWCEKAPDKIPSFLALHVNLIAHNPDKNQTVWTDFANFLFNTYGSREEVISAISINLGSPGVMIREGFLNYLESVQQAMMSLREHRHKNIRNFCKNRISYLQSRINQIKQREQESKELGLF